MWNKLQFLAIWRALRGSSMIRLGLSCCPVILPPICTCEIRKPSDKKIQNLNPKIWKNISFCHIPYVKPNVTKISGQYDLITEQTCACRRHFSFLFQLSTGKYKAEQSVPRIHTANMCHHSCTSGQKASRTIWWWTGSSDQETPPNRVKQLRDNKFEVLGQSDNMCTSSLGDEQNAPFCSCSDFANTHWPCKHFCTLFQIEGIDCDWSSLPAISWRYCFWLSTRDHK